jgi:hypothetical protein
MDLAAIIDANAQPHLRIIFAGTGYLRIIFAGTG